MSLFNRNKTPEDKELTPEQKVWRVLAAIEKYMQANEEILKSDSAKKERLEHILKEIKNLGENVQAPQANRLAEKAKVEGIVVDLESPATETEKANKSKSKSKYAGYLLAALVALGIAGWAYYYSTSDTKEDGKEKPKTEKVEDKKWAAKTPEKKKEEDKNWAVKTPEKKKEDAKKEDTKKWGVKTPESNPDASYQDHVKKLQEWIKKDNAWLDQDQKTKEALKNIK